MIQATSQQAFAMIQHKLGERQQEVLAALYKSGPMTNMEIKELLGWEINTVTPRTNELVKFGLVHEKERRPCRVTGKNAIAWSAYKETLF